MGRTKGNQDVALRKARRMRLSPEAVELRMDGLPTSLTNSGVLKRILYERVIEGKPGATISITQWKRLKTGNDKMTSPSKRKNPETKDLEEVAAKTEACDTTSEKKQVADSSFPIIRDIHRRAYVDKSGERRNCAYLVFRTSQEAKEFQSKWDGKCFANSLVASFSQVPPNRILHASQRKAIASVGEDPSLESQVSQLTRKELENRIPEESDTKALDSGRKRRRLPEMQKALLSIYKRSPRLEIHIKGYAIPEERRKSMIKLMRNLTWPAVSSRSRLNSECYMKISLRDSDAEYNELRSMLKRTLIWLDASYTCTHVAITKNFRGSPHVDRSDKSFQFALALGDYEGGELVIESEDHTKLCVVDTRNRVAKVDGRRVHWVRGFAGDERYSIIFFCLDSTKETPLTHSVFENYQPFQTPE